MQKEKNEMFMKIRGIALSIELLIFTQTYPNFFLMIRSSSSSFFS